MRPQHVAQARCTLGYRSKRQAAQIGVFGRAAPALAHASNAASGQTFSSAGQVGHAHQPAGVEISSG